MAKDAASRASTRHVRINAADLRVRVDTPGGPGGQHANRTRSRVTVELDLRVATSFNETSRARLQEVFGPVVRASSSTSRSQGDNRRAAVERLERRVDAALDVAAPRSPTRPKRSAVERRLEDKRRRSSIKRLRAGPDE